MAKQRGYRTALVGKNHTYLTKTDTDVWREFSHEGGYIPSNALPEVAEFDKWIKTLHFNVAKEPSPYPLTTQIPYGIVTESMNFIDETGDRPFLLQVSFPEPHDPEQVPAPYWNMFPPESVPARCASEVALKNMGPRAQWEYRLQQDNFPDTEGDWRRYVSNYLGGCGVRPSTTVEQAFTSMADVMPTMCEAIGAEIPQGVQGRSLWPLLLGKTFPREEFRSIYSGVGLGGLYYEDDDNIPTSISHDAARSGSWDELNKVTQSGNQKMLRMGDWKLVYDMMGYGQLYNLRNDPCELTNLFNKPAHAAIQAKLMAELAMWTIRTQDSLPMGPQNGKYQTKWSTQHNWYTPYQHGGPAPNSYIP